MQKLNIDAEFHKLIPPLSAEEYTGLEANILADGCRDALVVWQGTLIDGHNRYEICQRHKLEFKTITEDFTDRDAAIEWIIRNQFGRRNLTMFARAELALRLEPIIAARAKEKQAAGGKNKVVQISAHAKSRDQVAAIAGVSHDTIEKTKFILKNASEDTKTKLRSGKDLSLNEATNEIKKDIIKNRPKPEPIPLPAGKYNVILADPPWQYSNTGVQGAAVKEYSTMSINEICAMPIAGVATDNAVLFLWVTNPILEECLPVIKAWGFAYKTNFCWVKTNRKSGIGFYVRGVHELLLICTKGSMLPDSVMTPLSIIEADAGKHSAKPDCTYDIIEKMYPGQKYLELFARKKHSEKWTVWGNEVSNE